MIITSFFVEDKEKMSHFFEKTFFLADIRLNITLEILSFT